MASPPLTFASHLPASVRAASGSARKSDPVNRKPSTIASASSSSSPSQAWWAPIFGWSSDPDYVDDNIAPDKDKSGPGQARPKFAPGCFTEEKARRLRRKTAEGSSFHDAMYHSAIASRLATDLSDLAEK